MNPQRSYAGDIVCVDIDSTLADTRQRRYLCPTVDPDRTWDEYAAACGADAPIPAAVAFVQIAYTAGLRIHMITNRPETVRAVTVDWLHRHHVPVHQLHMRQPDQPFDDATKLVHLRELRDAGMRVALVLEDRPDTVAAIEAIGFPVLAVNPCYDIRPSTV